mgnify:CR=1 FL=1
MKNPFEFAKELLRYTRGELSKEEEKGIEQVLLEVKGMNTLVEELKDKNRIEHEMHIIAKFDTERALSKLKNRKQVKRRGILSWIAAASVVVIGGVSAWILLSQEPDVDNLSVTEKFESGKAIVTLEMASGLKYRLDTLSSVVRNNRVNVAFDNNDGVLKIKEQDSLADGATKEIGYNTVNVPYGGTYTVELCDGTKVYLNSGTTLEFPSRFDGKVRSVILKGEAYFDVRKDVARRFIVHLKESNVTVLGTSFNIKAYGDEDYIYTTLVEGKVRFTSEKEHEEVTLRPGMQSVLNLKSGKTELKEVEVEQFTAWRQGRFVFPSTTLGDLMCQLKRWYDIDVVYLSPEAKGYEFRGAINRDMDLKNVLAIVEKTSNVVFDINGRTIKVTIKNE